MKETLRDEIKTVIVEMGLNTPVVLVDYPADISHGDFYTNVAMVLAKESKKNPFDLANEIAEKLKAKNIKNVTEISAVKPGFINFKIADEYFNEQLQVVLEKGAKYGRNESMKGKKVVVEYTDPNPFKVFHIGHVMQNTIGESMSRLIEWTDADVKRFCYQGDVGRHVALAIFGLRLMDKPIPENASLKEKVTYLGQAYAKGATYFKDHPEVTDEVQNINKKIYEKSDNEVNTIYNNGREWSLEYFEEIYHILGTKFDRYFFESESSIPGIKAVQAGLEKGIFEKSDGAIIFNGEKYGLHTDVLITKVGLPTYAGKEIGLAEMKYDAFPYDKGYTITANEQNDFFKLTIKANELLFPFLEGKLFHFSHGMMKLPEGKMSSRTGDVVSGRDFIENIQNAVLEKMKDRDIEPNEKINIAEEIAVAAIKFLILKQTLGKDIVFDKEKAISFEGDSGPYIQYSFVRAGSVIAKSNVSDTDNVVLEDVTESENHLKRLISRFPDVVMRSQNENAPHYVAQYLLQVASSFNSFYANSPIAGSKRRLDLTKAFTYVVRNGLWLLGIKVPRVM